MPVTLHDVAREAGVSFKTVSNVINDYPYIRDSTRQRVLAAIEALAYKPNHSARSLRLGRTGLIGLAVPDVSLPYFGALSSEVIAAAARRGLVVVIEQTGPERSSEIDALKSSRRQMTDGLLFSPLALGPDDVDVLQSAGPMVLLGENVFAQNVDHVTMRNLDAARAATNYLISLGHSRIVAIGAQPSGAPGLSDLRLRGYREALEAAGLTYDHRRIGVAEAWHRREGADAMRRVLAAGADIDAVFAFNDTLALGAMHALLEAGFSVPSDVAVMGFDDIDEAQYSFPTLTTLDPGRKTIAELAVAALVDRIADPAGPARLIEVDFQIVPRDSTRQR